MKLRTFLAAEGATIDRNSNNLSIFNILVQINGESFPVIFPKLAVVTALDRKADEPDAIVVNVRIRQDKKTLLEQDLKLRFQGKLRTRHILNVLGLVIMEPGILDFRLGYEGKKLGGYQIEIAASPGTSSVRED